MVVFVKRDLCLKGGGGGSLGTVFQCYNTLHAVIVHRSDELATNSAMLVAAARNSTEPAPA